MTASTVISPFYPVLRLFFSKYVCTLRDLGLSMIHVAATGYSKKILECADITYLGQAGAGISSGIR